MLRWGQLGVLDASFVSASCLVATSPLPPAPQRSLSVLLDVAFSATSFSTPPHSLPRQPAAPPANIFTYYDPYLPPAVHSLSPDTHTCADGGRHVADVRSLEEIEVSASSLVVVVGDNFAPMQKLSCLYRRSGGKSIFDMYVHSLPAEFRSAASIACPIPAVYYADDGAVSTKMFFSVSNDGETYRYSSFKFTFVGGCLVSAFTKTVPLCLSSPRVASHRLASRRLAEPRLASPRLAPPHLAPPCQASLESRRECRCTRQSTRSPRSWAPLSPLACCSSSAAAAASCS